MSLYQQFVNLFNGTTKTSEVLKNLDNECKKIYTDINNIMAGNGHGHTGNGSDGAKIAISSVSGLSDNTGTIKPLDIVTKGPIVDVRAFGADATGTNDSTTAMQAAHNTGKIVYYPPGTYKFTTLTLAAGGIIGAGQGVTTLVSSDTSAGDVITFTGISPATFKDFTFAGSLSKTGGAAINIAPVSGENTLTNVNNVHLYQFYGCIHFTTASSWSLTNSWFQNYTNYGLTVENTNNSDSGDSVIQGCLFSAQNSTATNIKYKTSGGLKIIGNKFLSGTCGLSLELTGDLDTSDLLIVGNSFESAASTTIWLSRLSGTKTFKNIIIDGNQIAYSPNIIATDNSGAIGNIVITNNLMSMTSTTNGNAIALANVANFIIGGNCIEGNGGTPTGIYIALNCANGKILPNTYSNLTTPINCTNTAIFLSDNKQVGTGSATASSAYGSLFVGDVVITFSTPFLTTPTATVNMTSYASGGVGANVTAISTTGMTVTVYGVNNGTVIPFSWAAHGVL